jgi:hypothetical protein
MSLPRHPVSRTAPSDLDATFRRWLLATALVAAALIYSGDPLRNAAVAAGVFTLELNFGALPAMIASYDAETRHLLGFQLGLDFLFMPLYAQGLCLGLWRSRLRRGRAERASTHALCWAVWFAAACDGVENLFLLAACLGPATAAHGWGATWIAGVKIAILAVALVAWLAELRRRA